MSHETAMMASQIAACFIMFTHESYFLLSHHDTSIKNPAYRTKHSVIVARIPKTQLIAVCKV